MSVEEGVRFGPPGPRQVVVEVRAAGVNPVDTYVRAGTQGYAPPAWPWTPGSDAAGVVVDAAPDARWPRGARVFVTRTATAAAGVGTYATHVLCDDSAVFALPETLSFAQGACLGVPYGTAHRALFARGGMRADDRVLVHGASGGVGTAAVQLAAAAGAAAVVATASSPSAGAAEAALLRCGAVAVVRHGDLGAAREAANAADGFDIIVEMLADANLAADLKALAPGGRVMVVGSRADATVTPRDLMRGECDVRGVALRSMTPDEHRATYEAIADLAARGRIDPLVAVELPLDEAARAHEMVYAVRHLPGKIVLIP